MIRLDKVIRLYTVIFVACLLMVLVISASAAPTKITFMFRGGTSQEELVNKWITDFEEKNQDIKVEWMVAGNDITQKLPVLMSTGIGPDVFEMWGVSPREWAEKGMLLDLAPYVKRDFKQADVKDFFPVSWEASELQWGERAGMRYGIPSYANVFPIYYNKSFFAESGLATPPELDRTGKWTWDGLVQAGKKLTRTDGDTITRWALDDDSFTFFTARGAGWVMAAGGALFDFPKNPTRFMLGQPASLAGLQFMQDLIWKYQLTPSMNARGPANFRSGGAAMNLWLGTGRMGEMERNSQSIDWDLGPRPKGPAGRGYYFASDMFHINAQSKNKEAAWRFVKYLTSTEGMVLHMKIMGRGPVRRSAYPQYQSLYPNRATIYHINGLLDGFISPETLMVKGTEVKPLINQAVNNIANNSKSPSQALSEIEGAVTALYQ